MSQDPQCHNESQNPPGPGTSSAAPDSRVYSFHGDLVKIPEWNTSKVRVKRRKKKKELDSTKFKSHNEIFKKTFPRGFPQRNNMVGRTIPRSGGNDACNPMQVFITENRLTQHQGIFNREVRSIDIGRLVNQEVDTAKTGTSLCATESVRDTPQSQRSLSLGLIPTPELKNQEVHVPEKEHSPAIPAATSDPALCDQQEKESEKCPSCPPSDDRVNPGSGAATSPCRNQPVPILETAESIVNILSTHSLFPGRNLINEARQAILEKERNLRDTKTTPSAVAVQKKLEYNRTGGGVNLRGAVMETSRKGIIGNVDLYKDQEGECVGKGRTDIRRTVPRPHRAMQPIQTSPIRFLSIPKDSPPHTLIKMPGREDHLKLKDNFPIHYGSDCNPSYQDQQISSQSPHSLLYINSSSNDSRLGQQDINTSSFHRIRRARPMVSPPMNARSPQVRWRLADDILTDLSYTHNSPSGSIRHTLTSQVTNQECVCKTPLEDIFSKAPNPPKLSIKPQFSHEKTHSDVFWGSRDQRSPTTNIHDISPASLRWSYRPQSPPRMYTARNFRSQQMPVTGTRGSQGVFLPDSFRESGRETKKHVSSWQEADIGQHYGRCATNTRTKQQHLLESRCHNCWNPQFLLHEEPKHRGHVENDGDIRVKDWPHVERYMSVALSPHSVQQGPSFVPCQHSKSSKRASTKSSPTTWRYPRMKLY
ncbi:uncharacterized protein LOC130293665 isoform X2 [Hyla sarda]|nr:uncharacterized protein LOC130293665 isoform X2 [Hyla sarda]XP_056398621.1 uncharacterized protein LOC130293665 isoform X2 [Hyla sarda]